MVDYRSLEQRYGLPQNYLASTRQVESSGGRNTYNPLSRAAGDFQFIPSTARAYGLTNPYDPAASADAAARLARDNMNELRRAGIDPTPENLYLAHQQGATGAARLLSGGGAPAQSIVGQRAVDWNSGNAQMTGPQFADTVRGKFLSAAGAPQAGILGASQSQQPMNINPSQIPDPVYSNDIGTMARRVGNFFAPGSVDAATPITTEQAAAQRTADAATSKQYGNVASGLSNLQKIFESKPQASQQQMMPSEVVRGQYRPIQTTRGLL